MSAIPFGRHNGTPAEELPPKYANYLLGEMDNPDFFNRHWVQRNEELLRQAVCHIDPAAIPKYKLAEDQDQASREIFCSLAEDGNRIHRLQGGAGYGKSFAAIDVVIKLKRAGYQVRACACSYVASQNLAKDLEPLNVPVGTIASMLRVDVKHNGPVVEYKPGAATHEVLLKLLDHRNVLIVDEYSMVDDVIAGLLLDAAEHNGGRLLVIGDVYQLPSPAQDWPSKLCTVEPYSTLTIPKRYSPDSDLFEIEQLTRTNPELFTSQPYVRRGSIQVFQVADYHGLVNTYCDLHKAFPDQINLMLWFTRANMADGNDDVRIRLFGEGAQDVEPGENLRIMRTSDYRAPNATRPPADASNPEPPEVFESVRFYSGTTKKVRDVRLASRVVSLSYMDEDKDFPSVFEIPCMVARFRDSHGLHEEMDVCLMFPINENFMSTDKAGGREYNEAIGTISQWCKKHDEWEPYHQFRNSFVSVAYHYASTVHRVQGQSVDNVLTSPDALRKAPPNMRRQLQYVGLTRAKQRLIVL